MALPQCIDISADGAWVVLGVRKGHVICTESRGAHEDHQSPTPGSAGDTPRVRPHV